MAGCFVRWLPRNKIRLGTSCVSTDRSAALEGIFKARCGLLRQQDRQQDSMQNSSKSYERFRVSWDEDIMPHSERKQLFARLSSAASREVSTFRSGSCSCDLAMQGVYMKSKLKCMLVLRHPRSVSDLVQLAKACDGIGVLEKPVKVFRAHCVANRFEIPENLRYTAAPVADPCLNTEPPPQEEPEVYTEAELQAARASLESAVGADPGLWELEELAQSIGLDVGTVQLHAIASVQTDTKLEHMMSIATGVQLAAIRRAECIMALGGQEWMFITGQHGTGLQRTPACLHLNICCAGKTFVLEMIKRRNNLLSKSEQRLMVVCTPSHTAKCNLEDRGVDEVSTIHSTFGLGYHDTHTFKVVYSWLFNEEDESYWQHRKPRWMWQNVEVLLLDEPSLLEWTMQVDAACF